MPRFLLLLICVLLSVNAYSDDFQFGQHDDAFLWKRYDKDTNANAVVLKEYGKCSIIGYTSQPMSFYYHVRIKIFNKDGFENGKVVIPLQSTDKEVFESIRDLRAFTYVRKPDGTIEKIELDHKNMFREERNKHWDLIKFEMPNLQEGCIIEYSYTLESPYIFNFRDWEFQTKIPKIESSFEARIPGIYVYNGVLVGSQKLYSSTAHVDNACMSSQAFPKIDCSVLEYVMKDIPAFIEEDFMTSAKNFKSAIHFELSEYYGYDGIKHNISKEWKNVDVDMKKEENFGKQISRKGLFKDILPEIIADKGDDLSKAKAIYNYYQKWFRWNNYYGVYSENIAKAIKDHTGSVGDINLTLIAALTAAGLNTDAVLLSTRENGVINKLYPVEGDFNYVVAKVNIGADSFLLDATDPLLPFGLLPIRCMNDQGRVMNNKRESYWMDLKSSQKFSSLVIMMLKLGQDGKITGSWEVSSKGYGAYEKRQELKKYNTTEEYVEHLDEQLNKVKILKHSIENIDDLEKAVTEKYEIEIFAFDSLGTANLIYNPFSLCKVANPFKLAERTYPVDMGAPFELNITISLNFPNGYVIEGKPEDIGVALPNGGGKFITEVNASQGNFMLSQLLQFNKPIYNPAEYPYLKELYNKVVQTQKADIVLKKQI